MSDKSFNEANKLIDYTLDIFGGVDGGVGFSILRDNLEKCIENAESGDKNAMLLLDIFKKYDIALRHFTKGAIKF